MYQYFLSPLIGYLLGSIPFAWLIVKLGTGKDFRAEKEGVITTQKTIDLAGPVAGLIKGALDITKGFLSVFLIRYVIFSQFQDVLLITALSALGAVLGHSWQIWLGFRGGRAFSVFLGALIVINPWGILIWVGWVIIFFLITKYLSIAGPFGTLMVGIAFTLFYVFAVTNWSHWSILLVGWGYLLILTVKSIPNFIKISKGELEKGR